MELAVKSKNDIVQSITDYLYTKYTADTNKEKNPKNELLAFVEWCNKFLSINPAVRITYLTNSIGMQLQNGDVVRLGAGDPSAYQMKDESLHVSDFGAGSHFVPRANSMPGV